MIEEIDEEIVLYIDTSATEEVRVGISIGGEKDFAVKASRREKAQVTLSLIADLLDKHDLVPDDIDKIEVNTGPGSFTGLRVGLSIANTMGSFLEIPINNEGKGEIVLPLYGSRLIN